MAVFRVERNKGYTVMSNHHLRNKELSLKAKGLLSQMLSLPEDWDYTLAGLSFINREKIDAIREAVKELERAGYIVRSRERDEKGRLRGTDYPVSGITHTLTVQEIEQQTVPQNSFGSDRWIYPTHYIAMSYTLTPEPMENISVFDCDEGDRPIEVTPDDHSFRPVGSSSCFVVGVIGGADGPTAVIYGTNSQEKLHAACSALHFEPVGDDVEWRIVFNVTQFDKETFPII